MKLIIAEIDYMRFFLAFLQCHFCKNAIFREKNLTETYLMPKRFSFLLKVLSVIFSILAASDCFPPHIVYFCND